MDYTLSDPLECIVTVTYWAQSVSQCVVKDELQPVVTRQHVLCHTLPFQETRQTLLCWKMLSWPVLFSTAALKLQTQTLLLLSPTTAGVSWEILGLPRGLLPEAQTQDTSLAQTISSGSPKCGGAVVLLWASRRLLVMAIVDGLHTDKPVIWEFFLTRQLHSPHWNWYGICITSWHWSEWDHLCTEIPRYRAGTSEWVGVFGHTSDVITSWFQNLAPALQLLCC